MDDNNQNQIEELDENHLIQVRKEKLKALKFKNEYLKKYCLKDCLTTV